MAGKWRTVISSVKLGRLLIWGLTCALMIWVFLFLFSNFLRARAQGSAGLYVEAIDFSSDGKYMALKMSDGEIGFWGVSPVRRKRVSSLPENMSTRDWIRDLQESDFPMNRYYLVPSCRNRRTGIITMNIFGGRHDFGTVKAPIGAVDYSVALSPDKSQIVSGGKDGRVRLWNVSEPLPIHSLIERCMWNGHPDRIFSGHVGDVRVVTFSSDGKFLASAGEEDTVRVWNIHTGACIRTVEGKHFRDVTISPDGRYMATIEERTDVKLWSIETGLLIKTLNRRTCCKIYWNELLSWMRHR